jgi:hypothetical protein
VRTSYIQGTPLHEWGVDLKSEIKDKDEPRELAEIHTAWFGLFLVLLATVLVVLLSLAGRGSIVTIQQKEGISVFAVFYLMAQFIERAVEPFSEMKLQTKPEAKLFSDTDTISDLRKMLKDLSENKRDKEAEKKLDKYEAKRVFAFWGLNSFLGILLCYFTVGLFEVVGVSFQPLAVASRTITGHTFDSILSGMIVGAGSKPLHDLIGYLEKQEKTKSS